jgi:hypothetical protein
MKLTDYEQALLNVMRYVDSLKIFSEDKNITKDQIIEYIEVTQQLVVEELKEVGL